MPDSAMDSSARDPPPSCHPGTRVRIRRKLETWLDDHKRQWNMIWLYGPAGTGKYAVAQTFAEHCCDKGRLGAAAFFSRLNGQNKLDFVVPTIAYQLAVRFPEYKSILTDQIADDPQLLTKARRVQFKRLIIDPFLVLVRQGRQRIEEPFVIILDGLDECERGTVQCEMVKMINDAAQLENLPFLWLICSRSEAHLKYAFARAASCEHEELLIDAECRYDVELYLQDGLAAIRAEFEDVTPSPWPSEDQFRKLLRAVSGLFVLASACLSYIGNPSYANPVDQLDILLSFLNHARVKMGNPLATLDLLYIQILSNVPDEIFPTTRRILAYLIYTPSYVKRARLSSVQALCSFMHIDPGVLYGALRNLHSVIEVPVSKEASKTQMRFYHASFQDFLLDASRSGEYAVDKQAAMVDIAESCQRSHETDVTRFLNPFVHPQDSFQHYISYLPPELLCRILTLSLSDSAFDRYAILDHGDINVTLATSMMTTPLTVSAVCRYWRNVAFREPRLWNTVYLVACPHKAEIQANLLREWLLRSGDLPLTIEIDCSEQPGRQWSKAYLHETMTLLLAIFPYSTRCRTFRTRLPPSCLLPPSQCHIPDPEFANLTTLSIVPDMVTDKEGDEETSVIALFQHARNLQHVEIREIDFERLTISWANVVKVRTTSVSLDNCLRVLRAAPNVEYCAFEGILRPKKTPHMEPIVLSQLNFLHLYFGQVDSSQDLITRIIIAPNLKILEYVTQDGDDFPVQDFISCMQRSRCNLTVLHIIKPRMTAADVYRCLSQVSRSLEHLNLQLLSNVNGQIVTYKPPRNLLAPFFPRLESSIFSGPITAIYQLFSTTLDLGFDSNLDLGRQLLAQTKLTEAEFNSSMRQTLPVCHVNTREKLTKRIMTWVAERGTNCSIFWIIGPAGIGKSTISQTVEKCSYNLGVLGASLLFSKENGCNTVHGIILSIVYQLYIRNSQYQRLISQILADNPSILEMDLPSQFNRLIAEPFVKLRVEKTLAVEKPILVILDGLDEYTDENARRRFLELVIEHANSDSPLLWMITTRFEPCSEEMLAKEDFRRNCKCEKLSIDDAEARLDVSRFLRDSFEGIRERHSNVFSPEEAWPSKLQLRQLTEEASGSFAFASSILSYVNQSNGKNPRDLLETCISFLYGARILAPPEGNPLQGVDLLYTQLLSGIHPDTRSTTFCILACCALLPDGNFTAQDVASFLGIDCKTFYQALNGLHSVLDIPDLSEAHLRHVQFYHSSFKSFLRNPYRLGHMATHMAEAQRDVVIKCIQWYNRSLHRKHEHTGMVQRYVLPRYSSSRAIC